MNRRSLTPERNPGKHSPERVRLLGGGGLLGSSNKPGFDDGASTAAQIRALSAEVRGDQKIVERLKRSFESGLTRLVTLGDYHPRILEQLPVIGMLPLFQGHDDPEWSRGSRGYSEVGSYDKLSRDRRIHELERLSDVASLNKQVRGNYLSTRDRNDEPVVMHELAHRVVLIGEKGKHHVLREPLTNRVAIGVMEAADMDPTELYSLYQPHDRILERVVQAANLSSQELSYIISGPNGEENDRVLREVVTNRAGWNVVGFAQSQYLRNLEQDVNPNRDTYQAALAVEAVLDEEFRYQASLGSDLGYAA